MNASRKTRTYPKVRVFSCGPKAAMCREVRILNRAAWIFLPKARVPA
jgi:hypothetical protein